MTNVYSRCPWCPDSEGAIARINGEWGQYEFDLDALGTFEGLSNESLSELHAAIRDELFSCLNCCKTFNPLANPAEDARFKPIHDLFGPKES